MRPVGSVSSGQQARSAPKDGSVGPNTLDFVVKDSGRPSMDGTYRLECDPVGGDHPKKREACAAVDRAMGGERNPFRQVGADEQCAMIYGGPATAHVTGNWRGKPVDGEFTRANGCEVDRWDSLVPALPKIK
ncbi:hypothetical protein E0L36_17990 [Streptomyces sp. AJS327]|nr:hypothetical protein [Streptomyces sp. AJS327]